MYEDDYLESYYADRQEGLYFTPPYVPDEDNPDYEDDFYDDDEEDDYEEPELERCESPISGDEYCFGYILSDGICSRIREHI